jgi:hypothetical protein
MNRRQLLWAPLGFEAALALFGLPRLRSWKPLSHCHIVNCTMTYDSESGGKGGRSRRWPTCAFRLTCSQDFSTIPTMCGWSFVLNEQGWEVLTPGRVYLPRRELPYRLRSSYDSCNDCILIPA